MTRLSEIENEIDRLLAAQSDWTPLARTLAAEVDELRGKLNAVVKSLKPTPELIANAQMDYQAAFKFDVTRNFYHRACEIAGRTKG